MFKQLALSLENALKKHSPASDVYSTLFQTFCAAYFFVNTSLPAKSQFKLTKLPKARRTHLNFKLSKQDTYLNVDHLSKLLIKTISFYLYNWVFMPTVFISRHEFANIIFTAEIASAIQLRVLIKHYGEIKETTTSGPTY